MMLSELLVTAGRKALSTQRPDGSFPPGRNGIYGDPETPVRNTAHWAITLFRSFELTGERRFAEAADRAVAYLLSAAARPMGATFYCRTNPNKDMCNGLIGQAWAIEALAVAGGGLAVPNSEAVAREVFLLHPFDPNTGLWRRVNVDGSRGTFDLTFNHQLWFAAAGALLSNGTPVVGERVSRFLDGVSGGLLRLSSAGRIRHEIPHPWLAERTGARIRRLRDGGLKGTTKKMAHKEIGYHAFNLYGLAMLRECVPSHSVWSHPVIARALAYTDSEEFERGLEGNVFGYTYNPAGFEVAYAVQVFDAAPSPREAAWWVQQQLLHTYDVDGQPLADGVNDDLLTLTARLYEATRLTDVEVGADAVTATPG